MIEESDTVNSFEGLIHELAKECGSGTSQEVRAVIANDKTASRWPEAADGVVVALVESGMAEEIWSPLLTG